MRCALFGASLAGQVLLAAPSVFAQAAEAANAGDAKEDGSKSKEGSPNPGGGAKSEESEEKSDTEFTALPVVGGDSDVGIGGGVITSLARVEPDLEPYLWRIEAVGMVTLKPSDGYNIRYVDT
jgi:hypothetical protein